MSAVLYGVGVGPGDPDLITVKARDILRRVPVIAYPQLGTTPSLGRAIAAPHLPGGQREIAVTVPLAAGAATNAAYDRAARSIAAELAVGVEVAILCEGDPFTYGSFIQLWNRLKSRFVIEIIPGISSLMAAPARAGQPLGTGDERVAILPATLGDAELGAAIAAAESVAIIKVGRHLPRLRRLIAGLGLAERCRYVERATLAGERCLALAEVEDGPAPYFSMLLIRKSGEGGV